MREIELKPCPFCGSSAKIEKMEMPDGGKCYVIPATLIGLPPKVGALFWHCRSEEVANKWFRFCPRCGAEMGVNE